MLLGFGPHHVPARSLWWFVAAAAALAVVEYFAGVFIPVTVPTLLYFALLAGTIFGIRRMLERSSPSLFKNKRLLYALIAIFVMLALAFLGAGSFFLLAFVGLPLFQAYRRRGPRPVGQDPLSAALERWRRSLQKLGPLTLLLIGTAAGLLAASILANMVTAVSAATTYGEQAGLVHARDTGILPPIATNDVPIIEQTSARIVMSNAIGSLGPQYHLSDTGLSLVRFRGQLIWTAPLDYNSGLIWLTKRSVPGYVWMPADNPSAKPSLVLGQSYTITPEAGFSFNLERFLYQHFPTYLIGTSDWELDPSGHAYWVTSLYRPAPGLAAFVTRVIAGCALTDPATGSVAYYPFGKQPAWVSQVVGPEFAQNEAQRYGWDRAGFFAATFTHLLATQPVHAEPYNVLLKGGALGWEIPLTSPDAADNSLSGLILVNAENNAVTYTPFTGIQNDVAISQRIDGATINSSLSAGRALLYNFDGSLAYIAPVLNRSGIVQEVAIADPKNAAQPIIAASVPDALSSWQAYVASEAGTPGGLFTESGARTVTGTVQRVATYLESSGSSGTTVREYWLYLIGGVPYRADMSLAPSVVPFVRAGDRVTIRFIPGSGLPVTLIALKDDTLAQGNGSRRTG